MNYNLIKFLNERRLSVGGPTTDETNVEKLLEEVSLSENNVSNIPGILHLMGSTNPSTTPPPIVTT